MTPTSNSDTPNMNGRQLPTRVSRACERCRRNKSRCDPFRPCSLCVRANVECSSSDCSVSTWTRTTKRRRTRAPLRLDRAPSILQQGLVLDRTCPPRPDSEQHGEIKAHGDSFGAAAAEFTMDAESRRASVADAEADSALGIAQKICQLSDQGISKRTTSAIPGGDIYGQPPALRLDGTQRHPILSILGYPLPPNDVMRMLLEEYFDSVHWFSLAVYEPRFRPKFESIQDGRAYPSQKAFLLLLSTALGMGAWYLSHKSGSDANCPHGSWRGWALSLIKGVGSQLTDLLNHSSVASVQACILLGSYYLYHGEPNLSFALLGATIKTAQTIRLHREPMRGGPESIEERKRVWWTIYTWDRFASITYGRPLGINEKDCNVTQPADLYECPCFTAKSRVAADGPICYSTYQRELNKLYLIASPMIETIFGMRAIGPDKQVAEQQYITQSTQVTERLWTWRRQLPAYLRLDLYSDYEPNNSKRQRVHRLQALALQLTFDNLLIIIHRPLLAQQVDLLIKNQPESCPGAIQSPSNLSFVASSPLYTASLDAQSPLSRPPVSSTEQWWNSALRTSRVTEMPQLAQLATDSHLVAFLAINLFNSAIVLAVLALSDPLSDRAQDIKRTITRILRLQEVLGKKTKLSIQSNIILKDVIQMLLRREAEAMLAPVVSSKMHAAGGADEAPVSPEAPLMSVEDTLRLPMQPPLGTSTTLPDNQQQSNADSVFRLNESLASVQRVFPLGVDEARGGDTDNSDEWGQGPGPGDPGQLLEGNTDDAWFHTEVSGFQADGDATWASEGRADVVRNGLYWFWDSAWT